MKITPRPSRAILPETAILLALLFCLPESGLAEQAQASGANKPMELQLIVSPGKEGGNNITFSMDESQPTVKTKRKIPMSIDFSKIVDTATDEVVIRPSAPVPAEPAKTVVQSGGDTVAPVVDDIPPPMVVEKQKAVPATVVQPPIKEKVQEVQVQAEVALEETILQPEEEKIDNKPLYVDFKPTFSMSTGYRNDNFNFSISLPYDTPPNVLSELIWDDLDIFEITTKGIWSNSSHLYVRGEFGLGWIENGDVYDNDYFSDDRQDAFSRAVADADGGTVMDATVGAGYRFDLPLSGKGSRLHLMPMAGYGYNAQDFTMRRGVQLYAGGRYPFDGLDSTYSTIWEGPWLGVDAILQFKEKHSLTASLAYHWLSYDAEANWNLRCDFAHPISFEHSANGKGFTGSLAYHYDITANWFLNLEFDYRNFHTGSGDDITYFSDDSDITIDLNEAEWDSYSLLFGIGFTF